MEHVSKKLKSTSGASMLLALLFLFFCLTVGAVVLTAASATAGRTARNRQDQQNYLAVESAAMLVRGDLMHTALNASYKKSVTRRTVPDSIPGGAPEGTEPGFHTEIEVDINQDSVTLTPKTLLEKVLSDFTSLYYSTKPLTEPVTPPSTMQYNLSFAAAGLPDVEGSLEVSTEAGGAIYTITAVLYAVDKDGGRSNFTTLVFQPRLSPESTDIVHEGDTTIYTYTTTITWAEPVITKGGAAS